MCCTTMEAVASLQECSAKLVEAGSAALIDPVTADAMGVHGSIRAMQEAISLGSVAVTTEGKNLPYDHW